MHGPRLAAAPDTVTAMSNVAKLLRQAKSLFGVVAGRAGGFVRRLGIDYAV